LLLGLICSALLMIGGLLVAMAKNQPRPEGLLQACENCCAWPAKRTA